MRLPGEADGEGRPTWTGSSASSDAAVDDTALAFAIGGIAIRLIPELGPDERRSWILAELRELLGQGLLQAGYPSQAGFQPWPLAPDRCIERIDREWQALARDPKPGEVVWFTTTDKGHEAAKELVLQVVGGHERSWAASETAGR